MKKKESKFKTGRNKYHKHMSNIIVTKYIMSCIGIDNKKPFWHSN